MTHTTHRLSSPGRDYIIHLRTLQGKTDLGSGKAHRLILEKILPLHPVNVGSQTTGDINNVSMEQILAGIRDGENFHIVFDDKEPFLAALETLRQLDTGLSVIISAPRQTVQEVRERFHLDMPAVVLDIGILNPPQLPTWEQKILSQCGHMRLSLPLARQLLADIRNGTLSPDEAAHILGKPCTCGCYNAREVSRIFQSAIKEPS